MDSHGAKYPVLMPPAFAFCDLAHPVVDITDSRRRRSSLVSKFSRQLASCGAGRGARGLGGLLLGDAGRVHRHHHGGAPARLRLHGTDTGNHRHSR